MKTTTNATAAVRIDLDLLKKTTVHLVIFGHGNVGGSLIRQLLAKRSQLFENNDLDLKIIAIANSKVVLLSEHGATLDWEQTKEDFGTEYSFESILEFVKNGKFENLIAVDNTADEYLVRQYERLVNAGFHLISSNKKANTKSFAFYQQLRETLQKQNKKYLYETNVGAGLPLINTIALLHASGENITKIRGVFSGSLSYIFNTFSGGQQTFSEVLKEAIEQGLTEPDPRDDLGGMDVARKLLILARELDLHNELDDVSVQNLIPKALRRKSKTEFLDTLEDLDVPFSIKKKNCRVNDVLRYVAEIFGDLSKHDGAKLSVRLKAIEKNSVIGQLSGSDTIFEIYTENYDKNPIVIQGAGAGGEVTARGVFGDILRLCEQITS